MLSMSHRGCPVLGGVSWFWGCPVIDITLLYKMKPELLNVWSTGKFGSENALHLACKFGSRTTFDLLINELKMDVRPVGMDGRNLLTLCAQKGNDDNLRYMYSIKPSWVNERDKHGTTSGMLSLFFHKLTCLSHDSLFFS